MKLEDQVTSFELSKRLKELGVKQNSYFWWNEHDSEAGGTCFVLEDKAIHILNDHGGYESISAFTVAELGEMIGIHLGEFRPSYVDETEADYRAEALIFLIENKLIEVPK